MSAQRGFVMFAVLVTLVLVAAIGLLLTTEGAADAVRAGRGIDVLQADYAVLAALEHAAWKADRGTCASYSLPSTTFGAHSYSATYSAGAGSPVDITATATLASGVLRARSRAAIVAHQAQSTATLQLGAVAGADALVDAASPNSNSGGATYVRVSANPSARINALLRFDVSSIPYGAHIVSARLELRMWSLQATGAVAVRRVSRAWVEGTRTGGGAADGATWATYDGANAWTTAGGDFAGDVVSRTAVTSGNDWVAFDLAPVAQAWVDGEPNNGVALVGEGALRTAEFASRQTNNAPDRPKLTITYACECGVACARPQGSGKLMFVASQSNPALMRASDLVAADAFRAWGYTVTYVDDDATQSAIDSALAAQDVVFVSDSADDAKLANKLANATIGVVSVEGQQNDNLGIASSASWVTGDTLTIADNTHYITQVFAAGPLRIYAAKMEATRVGGSAAPGLQSLGTWAGTASLAVLEAGAAKNGGGTAAGRRALLPLGRNLDWRFLNNNGRLLAQRALEWGTGNGGGCASTTPLLFVVSNPTTPTSQEAGRKTVLESWCYAVTLIDDAATQAQYDAAVAAAAVVYISAEAVTAQVGTKLKAKTIGIVNEDPGLHITFGFSTARLQASVNLALSTDSAHYITSPFGGAAITLFTSSQPSGSAAGTLPAGLVSVGTWSSGTFTTLGGLLTLETGAAIAGGGTAAGRRVQMPWDGVEGGAVTDIAALTTDGRTILRRSLAWAAGAGPQTGPVAYWKLDETSGTTAVDSVGGHNGTLTGGPTWTSGQLGGALALNGVNNYVVVPHSPALSLTQAFTLMAFARPSVVVGDQAIIAKGDVSPNYNYALIRGDNQFRLSVSVGGVDVDFQTTNANLQANRWYHMAATFDNAANQVRLYLDGAQVYANNSVTLDPTANSGLLFLGRSQRPDEYWAGSLDDLRIYNRVLSTTEISAIATSVASAGYYLDGFPDFTCDGADEYRGSNGTLDWSAFPWIESGDDGRACGANLRAVDDPLIADATGNRLRLQNKNRTISRQVNLSGAAGATLSFDYRRASMTGNAAFGVMASANGGITWTTLATFPAGNDSAYQHATYDISAVIGANSKIAFFTNANFANEAYIDNVRVDLTGGGGGGSSCTVTFADDFESGGYAGSSGTGTWATNWLEVNEADGPTGGDERIVTSTVSGLRAQVKNQGSGAGEGLQREVNLSAYTSATLRLTHERSGLDDATDYATLALSRDGGASWTEIDRFAGPASVSTPQVSFHNITSYIGPNTRIRVLTSPTMGNADIVFFDDVVIEASNCP